MNVGSYFLQQYEKTARGHANNKYTALYMNNTHIYKYSNMDLLLYSIIIHIIKHLKYENSLNQCRWIVQHGSTA